MTPDPQIEVETTVVEAPQVQEGDVFVSDGVEEVIVFDYDERAEFVGFHKEVVSNG